MNTQKRSDLNSQRGAATLLTALVLLIGITLVTLTTSKTVLVETQMAADNYRTSQAVAAANYAMDYGVNYFDNGGFDQKINATAIAGSDNIVDTVLAPNLVSADGSQTTSAQLTFNNAAGTRCVAAGTAPAMKNGLITAIGFSDDTLATRTITQCVGPINVLRNGGPKQSLVAQGDIGLSGNARIINRYSNTTIWSGGRAQIGSSSSMSTYIKDPAVTTALNPTQLTDTNLTNTQLTSNRNLGNGLDIIDDDPSLGNLIGLDFFKNFFAVDSRAQLKGLAGTQSYTTMSGAENKSGLVWVEGDQSMTGGTIGSINAPVIVVVNGDFTLSGGATIYGILYVTGRYTVNGTPQIIGSNIVEGTNVLTESPATSPVVQGNGTISLVYWPAFATGTSNPTPGLTAVVSGSWRDW